MFTSGFAVFIGVFLLLIKMPRRWLLRCLGHDLLLDLSVSLLVFVVHLGTFSGLMAATIAGLLMSMATSLMKRGIGYIKGGFYYPGYLSIQF